MLLPARSNFTAGSTLMVQGCTSDAGKSIVVAGLCRLLARQGVRVAPFKPQNMALNSAVTADGGEIGRAQAVQAFAAGVEPHTDMNPVLLKPSSDTGAQVIVHGKVVDAMQAKQFHDYKKVAMQAVLDSHGRLSQAYQQVMVEGAGSPAEVNLRDGDIANMGFAEAADCPVILIADIDRGGVFAHLAGTLEVLATSEQARIVGFVINKFRGDIKLLEPGLEWLEQRTQKPVLGVLPYLPDFFLDAEDAITPEQKTAESETLLKVVVPVLPRISNHTDFDALRLHPLVDLQFVSSKQCLPPADLVILPGSKNVLADLQTLREAGWEQGLKRHLRYGGKVIGICGGLQMLGHQLVDQHAIESNLKQATGFGLLGLNTELKPEKQLENSCGHITAPGFEPLNVSGYEIHCGISLPSDDNHQPFCQLGPANKPDGAVSADGQILATYLHGLFDTPATCDALLAWAGLADASGQAVNLNDVREQELERLADCLQGNLHADFLKWLVHADSQHSQQRSA